MKRRVDADAERSLLSVLRDDLDLTGTKYGCGEGQCAACTVLLDGVATRSCLTKAGAAAGKRIVTIEGLAPDGRLHPMQQAFLDADALQCGWCTPGMILGAVGLLRKNPNPSEAEIVSRNERPHLPLRHVSADRRGDSIGGPEGRPRMKRREFFRGAGRRHRGAGWWTIPTPRKPAAARGAAQNQAAPTALSAWLHIGETGAVTVYTGKVEVGQNARTSLTQAVAEELHAPIASIQMVMGDTALTPFDQGTFGSQTTPRMWPQIRKAAATAREMLLDLAAEKWSVERSDALDRERQGDRRARGPPASAS